jgi:hypothetical protein
MRILLLLFLLNSVAEITLKVVVYSCLFPIFLHKTIPEKVEYLIEVFFQFRLSVLRHL